MPFSHKTLLMFLFFSLVFTFLLTGCTGNASSFEGVKTRTSSKKKLKTDDIIYDREMIKSALEIAVDESKTFFAISLGILGTLSSLIFVKKDDVVITWKANKSAIVLAALTALILLVSMVCHYGFTHRLLTEYRALAGYETSPPNFAASRFPDLSQGSLSALYACQFYTLAIGLILSLVTLSVAYSRTIQGEK